MPFVCPFSYDAPGWQKYIIVPNISSISSYLENSLPLSVVIYLNISDEYIFKYSLILFIALITSLEDLLFNFMTISNLVFLSVNVNKHCLSFPCLPNTLLYHFQ